MAKSKNPLLSLGAQGTVGEALTVRRSRGQSIIEKKPLPAYRNTLPQQYQRWLYQDYVALWLQQSIATKRQWQSNASRHHMTGFAYWMRYYLQNLPDILAYYKLDTLAGGVTPDSGPNGYHATVIGAISTTARIDGGALFDGLNDELHCGIITPRPPFCVHFFVRPLTLQLQIWVAKGLAAGDLPGDFQIRMDDAVGRLRPHFHTTGAYLNYLTANAVPLGVLSHVCCCFETALVYCYINGVLDPNSLVLPDTGAPNAHAVFVAAYPPGGWFPHHGDLDHIFLMSRIPTQSDVTRWSERRYP